VQSSRPSKAFSRPRIDRCAQSAYNEGLWVDCPVYQSLHRPHTRSIVHHIRLLWSIMRPSSVGTLVKFLLAVSTYSDLARLVSHQHDPSLIIYTSAAPNNASFHSRNDVSPDTLSKHAKRMVEYDPPRRHDHRRNPHYHPHFRRPHLHPAYGGTSEHEDHGSEHDEDHGSKEEGADESQEEEGGHANGHPDG
jgi:hypothetical protein